MARGELEAFGVRLLLAGHREIRRLRGANVPTLHGNRQWDASWLLIDYLERRGLPENPRVMEIGCGWGLASIYCARVLGADVTAVDLDRSVFPYLRAHANLNRTRVKGLLMNFAHLSLEQLGKVDVVIGSDVCFWDELGVQLRRLVFRALGAGVRRIVLADPGRGPFEDLADYFVRHGLGAVGDWETTRPHRFRGRILKITDGNKRRNKPGGFCGLHK